MITNATLISIAPAPASDGRGRQTAAAAVASGKRVLLDEPKRAELMSVANKVTGTTAMLYVELPDAAAIAEGSIVVVQQDELPPVTLRVLHRVNHVLNDLRHAACYCGGVS